MDQSQVMFEVPHLDDSSSMVLEDLPTKLGHVKGVPSGKHTKSELENHHLFREFSHEKWVDLSVVFCMFTRG